VKQIAYILSFYLILLSVVPCCAFDDCPDDKTEQSAEHNKGDEDCGTCSPFFSCQGCATTAISTQHLSLDIPKIESAAVYATYLLPSLPSAAIEFWQPPKLG
jgi:hypothetical protein